MSGSTIGLWRTPLSLGAWRRVCFLLTMMPALLTSCGSQTATPGATTTAPVSITASPASTAAGSTASTVTATSESGVNTDRPARAVLEQHALEVLAYPPGDAAACGLPLVEAPADASASARVFWGCTPATGPVLAAVPARQIQLAPDSDPKASALRTLLAGPTEEERQAGYLANFGAASQNVAFIIEMLDGGLVVVDFDAAIRDVEFIFVSSMDAAQIVATLGQFPDVERVTILIDGKLLCEVTEQC